MKIDQHISALLYDYDCVVVPQLGGFVTNYRPAKHDANSGMAEPPGKDIRFNKNLTKSDGLLEKAMAEASGLNFEEASASLKKEVEQCWSKLNGGEKLQFNKIGVLYIDDHKNLRFEPSGAQNFLKSTYGLEPFTLPEIKLPAPRKIDDAAPEIEKPKIIALPRSKRNTGIYWVAAATMVPFIAMSMYIGWSSDFKSPTQLNVAELNPFAMTELSKAKYEARTGSAHIALTDEENLGFPEGEMLFPYSFEKSAVDSTGVWIDLRDKTEAPVASTSHGVYHIIAGCFGEADNASTFVHKLKGHGYDAAVLDKHKALYRVKIGSFESYEAAIASLDQIRSSGVFPSAWLLKKPVS